MTITDTQEVDGQLQPQLQPAPEFQWIEAAGGPRVTCADKHRIDGMPGWWTFTGRRASLNRHIETDCGTLMLTMGPDSGGGVAWESTLKVGEGRYVRRHGAAASFNEARAAVESLVHEPREIGGLTWWAEGLDHWTTWIGSVVINARKVDYGSLRGLREEPPPPWHFEISGNAETFEEAAAIAAMGRISQ